jgi:hypothetical protein
MIALLLFTFLCGCSGSKNPGNPVVPSESGMDASSSLSGNIAYPSNRTLLGLWDFHVDPTSQTITGSQVRTADMHLNLVRLLEQACTDCLTFSNADFSVPGQLSIDMTMKHPFQDELIFTVFDLRGIFITDRLNKTWINFSWGDDLPFLVNSDGYTYFFNEAGYPFSPDEPAMFNYYPGKYSYGEKRDAYLNAYVSYGKDNPRRMFLPGTEETRTLTIKLPGIPFDFGYVIDASWDIPVVNPVVDPVADFPLSANCFEAYQLNVTVGDGLTGDPYSKAPVTLEIFDHQGLDTIVYHDNYGGLPFEGYDIQADLVDPEDGTFLWSSAYYDNPFEFSTVTEDGGFLFTNVIDRGPKPSISSGTYPLSIRVVDTEEDPNLGFCDAEQVVPVAIPDASTDALPVAEAVAYPLPQSVGKPVGFYDNGSYDPDGGAIVKWEWDWNFDGIYDDEGVEVHHFFDNPGTYYVNLRVTDDEGSSRALFKPLEVTIKEGSGWARTWGSMSSDAAWDVAVDSQGNEYVAGYYWGTTDFDPGPGIQNRDGYGDDVAGYVSKFDKDGNFIWVRTMGGLYNTLVKNLILDDNGNIFVTGDFWPTISFEGDPSGEVTWISGGINTFICSYSTNGDFQWAKFLQGPEVEQAGNSPSDMNLDSEGNIFVGGSFLGEVDFDPGSGIESHTAYSYIDAYLLKLTSSGQFIWVNTWGSEPYDAHQFSNNVVGLACDSSNSVYCAGIFQGVVDFDPGPETDVHEVVGWSPNPPNYEWDIYISKFNSAGEHQWAGTWGGESRDLGYGIALDNNDNITVIGYFEGTVDFDPGPGVLELTETSDYSDPFISRFNTDGEFIWVKSWNAETWWHDGGLAITSAPDNSIYVTGNFDNHADFDPGPEIVETTNYGNWDYYLSKFNPDGEFLWVRSWGGPGKEYGGYGVAVDPFGYASVIGVFCETADFDPGPGYDWHTAPSDVTPGYDDSFLTHFPPDGNW